MTLKSRRYIFWFFLILFILAGTGAIFYSSGWRLNLEKCSLNSILKCGSLEKTGAVFVETLQKNVSVKIGNEIFSDKAGLLQSGTLISDLLPKNYYVEIEKAGYQVWQKNIEVLPSLVSKITKVILVPTEIKKQSPALTDKVSDFYFSNKEELVFQNANGLYYYGQKNSPLKLRGSQFVLWNDAGDAFMTKDAAKNIYYLYRLNDLSKSFNITAALGNLNKNAAIKQIVFHPSDSDKIIIESKNGFYIMDLVRLKLETINQNDPLAWTIQNPNAYYLKKTSASSTDPYGLYAFNLILKSENLLYEFQKTDGFQPDSSTRVFADNGKTAVVKNKENLFIINLQNKELKKIPVLAGDVIFSPDKQKIAFWGADNKIGVYLLENAAEELSKNKGDTIYLDSYSQNYSKITSLFWYKDSHHLLAEYLDGKKLPHIDFIEVDSRLPINKYELASGEKSYYNPQADRLYFMDKSNLYFVDLSSF